MSKRKPWRIHEHCLIPLADELFVFASRFPRPFDVAKRDRLDAEYRAIIEGAGYSRDRLTDEQKQRLDELSQQMRAQNEPPRPEEVDRLYDKYNIDLAADWLKANISIEYAEDFTRTLTRAAKRFHSLDFKACQIINGDLGKESTISVRYAIQRLTDWHNELLRKLADKLEIDRRPEPEEMPEEMRRFEKEILDEYIGVEHEFRETAKYLLRVASLARSKLKKAASDLTKEEKAIMLLYKHPEWTSKKIAEHVPCNPKSLNRMKAFQKAKQALESGREERRRGTKYGGQIEAETDG